MKLLDAFTCRGVLHVRRPIGVRVRSMEDVGRYLRQMWGDFQKALQIHMMPGEKFGREAVYMFLVGTVPAFLAGSTSAALLLGIAPGFIAGLGMIVAFTHCQSKRSRERRMKAALIFLISEMKKDDFRFLFPKAVLPRWIVTSDLEKVNWINILLRKIWPFFNEVVLMLSTKVMRQAYSRMLMENWAPYLETYKPAFANSVVFEELTLGSIAPHFEGLRMLDLEPKAISLDVDTRWLGNGSCILGVSSIMGVSFPVQVKNIHMRLVFRFIFTPLVDELPGFGAITYSIRKQKKFDFIVKVIGGDISNVPGVAEKLQDMIRSAVLDSLSWPMRKCIKIIPAPADGDFTRLQRHLYPRRNAVIYAAPGANGKPPVGILDIKLVQGRDLLDTGKPPDPFALLYIHATPGHIRRSTTIRHDSNPIWNELFELEYDDLEEGKVVIVLYNDAAPQEFQVLGYCQFYLQALVEGRVTGGWLKVYKDMASVSSLQESKYRGKVNVELVHRCYDEEELKGFQDVSTNSSSSLDLGGWLRRRSTCLSNRFSRKGALWELMSGVLAVTVLKAENLLPSDYQGKSDPYVELQMIKQKRVRKKTRVLHSTLNPIWDETFHFPVDDARQDMLLVVVWNDETFGKDFLGSTATTLTRVIQQTAFEVTFRLVGVPCGKVSLRLEWTTSTTPSSAFVRRPQLEHNPSSHGFLHLLSGIPHHFD